ncbi:hypothetical protein F4778DRAFT_794194 [Xylariomycetidae sp. FL2044]|nr:hypothetical protein F4778DRAFT_794194 [Xylariomycetidae sp. FL2044]
MNPVRVFQIIADSLKSLSIRDTQSSTSSSTQVRQPLNLMELPREIRNKIYSHHLTLNQTLPYIHNPTRWEKNFNVALLRVNRQMRAEAWDVIIKTNTWILVLIHTKIGEPIKPDFTNLINAGGTTLSQPVFGLILFSEEEKVHMKRNSSLVIGLDECCGINPAEVDESQLQTTEMMFAYHDRSYGFFVNQLLIKVPEYKCMSLDFRNPAFYNRDAMRTLRRLLSPLWGIRGLEGVYIPGFEDEGRFHEALCTLWHAKDAFASHWEGVAEKLGIMQGEHVGNTLFTAQNALDYWFSYAVMSLVTQQRRDRERTHPSEAYLLDGAISCASNYLAWDGLHDDKRADAHALRGISFWNKAQYLTQTRGARESSSKRYGDPLVCYEQAARDFFYAIKHDETGATAARLNVRYAMACSKINRPTSLGFPLWEVIIPLLGTWRGDPRLLVSYGVNTLILKMTRLREHGSDEDMRREWTELRAEYSAVGVDLFPHPCGRLVIYTTPEWEWAHWLDVNEDLDE